MNFFQHQANARRKTGVLVGLFALAVICLIAMTQLLVMVVLRYASNTALTLQGNLWSSFSWQHLAMISTGIIATVGLASFYKMAQLSSGGAAVAEMLGGELLDRASSNLDERKILNIVEEMAIASGMPVPPVYIIEEPSINAFAAGHDIRDTAIGITRGCIELLNRDELQGVIAHEFSHIFNGDMRLNLRLIGVLHGILFIGLVGRTLLDTFDRRGVYISTSRRDDRGAGPLIFLGLGLVIIGYCGTLFGNIIKAAISRQREFLADASAVQFTRNPSGIADALKKISIHTEGSVVAHPNASQVSHLFFGNGLRSAFALFATHPPLEERILAIEPNWKGDYPKLSRSSTSAEPAARSPLDPAHVHIVNGEIVYTPPDRTGIVGTRAVAGLTMAAGAALATVPDRSVEAAIEAIGAPGAEHLAQAQQTLEQMPERLQQMARDNQGAMAVVHCLLAHRDDGAQTRQMDLLGKTITPGVYSLCEQLIDDIGSLAITLRLPLIDLCLPSLKTLGLPERTAFINAVMAQIREDGEVSLFEWALYRLLRQHLDTRQPHGGHTRLAAMADSCRTVMSALALATHEGKAAETAFAAAWQQLGLPEATLDRDALVNMAKLDGAVRQLNHLQALAKPRLLKAGCAAIRGEAGYAPASVELLRAVADSIDTPIPPLLDSANAA